MGCNFCDEERRMERGEGLSYFADDLFFALPTLGCFLPGYSLIVSRMHVKSMASLPEAHLARLESVVEKLRAATAFAFGGAIVAEHGSGALDEPTAACCEHAHIHVIPVRGVDSAIVETYQSRGGPGTALATLTELSKWSDASYLSLSCAPGDWRLWGDAMRFPRQFVRRAAAESIGKPELFDWRAHPFVENMPNTSRIMGYALKVDDTAAGAA